jgi:hypothetical protein
VKRLVWLYPRRWRERYGREMIDLLAASRRPWRDGMNIAAHAALAWSEVAAVKVVVTILAAGSLVTFGFTVGQLADGIHDVLHHWWSSISAVVVILAVGAATVSLTRPRSTYDA